MRLKKVHWIGIIAFSLMVLINVIFFRKDENLFFFLFGISLLVLSLPFLVTLIIGRNIQKEKNVRFLEFTRNLAESVKTGTPIGKSIVNMREKNFGSLSPHVKKLANQITLGVPIGKSLQNFAEDVNNSTIKRAIALIRESESAGGQIESILDSVAKSVYQTEKLKKERKAAIYNLVVEGYIIFFVFIGIMLVMQFKILPLTADVGSLGGVGGIQATNIATGNGEPGSTEDLVAILTRPFLYLLLIQGIFAGFTIGKLSEGSIKAGIKHSFILAITALLISTGATVFL